MRLLVFLGGLALAIVGGLCEFVGGPAVHGWSNWAMMIVGGLAMVGGIGTSTGEGEQPTASPPAHRPPAQPQYNALPAPSSSALADLSGLAREGAAAEKHWRDAEGRDYTQHNRAVNAARRLYSLGDNVQGNAYASKWSAEFRRAVRYEYHLEND